jgi:hypothetical protein
MKTDVSKSYAKIFFSAIMIISSCVGCTTQYRQEMDASKTKPSIGEKSSLISKKFDVPLKIAVTASNDAIGQSGSFMGQNIYHYPLRQLLESCYRDTMNNSFKTPDGEDVNAFELHLEPQCSILTTSGDTAKYRLTLYASFYEPGGKKIVSVCIDKENSGPVGDYNQVPDVVYQTIKELAVETVRQISTSQIATQVMSRYMDK